MTNTFVDPVTQSLPLFLKANVQQNDGVGVRYVQVTPATIAGESRQRVPGSVVTVSGAGFAANAPLTVLFVSGSTVVTTTDTLTVTSSISGTFTYALTDPAPGSFRCCLSRSGRSRENGGRDGRPTVTGGGPTPTPTAPDGQWAKHGNAASAGRVEPDRGACPAHRPAAGPGCAHQRGWLPAGVSVAELATWTR